MNDPFLGMIVQFAGNYAPRGWALCQGQEMPINQHDSLFSILGTKYGGDGRTTFALPDLRGRVAMHPGHGPGLSTYKLGEQAGKEAYQMTEAQMPAHMHYVDNVTAKLGVNSSGANSESPVGGYPAPVNGHSPNGHVNIYHLSETSQEEGLKVGAVVTMLKTGGSQFIDIRRPTLCINYIIALQGEYPSRT